MARPSSAPKIEFSKELLNQELKLIWFITIAGFILAFVCVFKQYFSELAWITAMIGFPWTAYGVSQACYYRKASLENRQGGLKYEATMAQLGQTYEEEYNNI